MKLTTKITAFLPLLLLVTIMSCKQQEQKKKKESPDDLLPIELKTVQLGENRWEYDIYVDHKMYIKQDRIPAVAGLHAFVSKEEAERTGNLVVEKIKRGEQPALTKAEIQQLNITVK